MVFAIFENKQQYLQKYVMEVKNYDYTILMHKQFSIDENVTFKSTIS